MKILHLKKELKEGMLLNNGFTDYASLGIDASAKRRSHRSFSATVEKILRSWAWLNSSLPV